MCEEDRGKTERETQLMATRLVAISEILSLQEARLTQVHVHTCTLYTYSTVYMHVHVHIVFLQSLKYICTMYMYMSTLFCSGAYVFV